MLKNITIRRISLAASILFICLLLVIFPDKEVINLEDKEEITYTTNINTHEIFMVNKDNYVAKTDVILTDEQLEDKIRSLIEYLIVDSKKEDSIPNGFRSIIPSGTEINKINIKDGILEIDFSKEILEIDESLEIKMYESIIYTITTIPEIEGLIIYVDGNLLKEFPKTKTKLPDILDRTFGINKEYNIDDTKNITKTTVYYIGKNNNEYYYIPVTKIDNNTKDKVDIIIDELTSTNLYDGLMSFLNINAKLLNYEIKDKSMYLTFNEYVYNSIENKDILEEVKNSITYSIEDNYDIDEVIFLVD